MNDRGAQRVRVGVSSTAVNLNSPGLRALADNGVDLVPIGVKDSCADQFHVIAEPCRALIAGAEPYPARALERLPNLAILARSGVGYDQVDVQAASQLGIAVTITPGLNADAVAEHTIALMLALLHRIPFYDARVRHNQWRDGRFFPEVRQSRVGVVGLGQIGRNVARLVKALGAEVHGFDPALDTASPLDPDLRLHTSLADLLPAVDIVTLHVPLVPSTERLIGATEFSLLRAGAYLVNASRGGVVDQDAMIAALDSGQLAGAALDVFRDEPPTPDNPLLSMPQCVLSPHIAGLGEGTIDAVSDLIAAQISDVLAGRLPAGLISDITHVRPLR